MRSLRGKLKAKKHQDEEMAVHQPILARQANEENVERRVCPIPNDSSKRTHFCNNAVTTSKYSLFPFSPHFILYKNLFEQFHKGANVYFLFVSILQVIPGLSPTGQFTTLGPLAVVLFISLMKDAWEDWKRRDSDRKFNSNLTKVFRNGVWVDVKWSDVAVSDLCLMHKDEPFPADMVLLWSSDPDGKCYIETSNLDGETNLKMRKTPAMVHTIIQSLPKDKIYSCPVMTDFRGQIVCETPNNRLYDFDGYFERFDGSIVLPRIPLAADNVLMRGAVVRNTNFAIGATIFTGNETKLMMNSINVYLKRSDIERTTNRQIFLVFCFEVLLSIISVIGFSVNSSRYVDHWYLGYHPGDSFAASAVISFFTFIILFNSLIPISLYVTLEVVRLVQALLIDSDAEMYDAERDIPAVTRSSKLNEELGQVSFVFSDKTGTLTCNVMQFRQFSCFSYDATGTPSIEAFGQEPESDSAGAASFHDLRINDGAWRNQPNAEMLRTLFHSMATCHTVLPGRDSRGSIVYQASSPDEACLVRAAKELGVVLFDRSDTHLRFLDGDQLIELEVAAVVEFSSDRKRMSIIVKDSIGRHTLYCKGADEILFDRLRKDATLEPIYERTRNLLKEFAQHGLRTLVWAKTDIPPDVFKRWKHKFDVARTSIAERQIKIEAAADEIERDMQLVGTTASEDRLQDEVPQTIRLLGDANVKIWVLTGDKQETAINIGYASSLLTSETGLFRFDDCDVSNIRHALEKYLADVEAAALESGQEIGLVIEGFMLDWILPTPDNPDAHENETDLFVSLAARCKTVICCRVSPIQKAQVVRSVKQRVTSVTLSIGDGANDVSMIQTAHVGIGISGVEGLQAARSADYSIAQFRFLKRLLLVHGRWSYRRIAKLIVYSFYKNMALYLTQFWYNFYNMFTGQSLYDSWALASYNVGFAAFPIMALAVFDRDVEPPRILSTKQFPELYGDGLNNALFNTKRFWQYTVSAVFHSIMLFWLPLGCATHLVNPTEGYNLGLAGHGMSAYMAVLFVVTLKCGIETFTWTVINIATMIASIFLWFLFLIIYCSLYPYTYTNFPDPAFWFGADIQTLGQAVFWLDAFLVTTIALARDFIYKYYRRNYNPHLIHCVQAFEAAAVPFNRDDVRRFVPWLFPKHEMKVFTPSLAEGIGNFRFKQSTETEVLSVSARVFAPDPTQSPGRRRQKISEIIASEL